MMGKDSWYTYTHIFTYIQEYIYIYIQEYIYIYLFKTANSPRFQVGYGFGLCPGFGICTGHR